MKKILLIILCTLVSVYIIKAQTYTQSSTTYNWVDVSGGTDISPSNFNNGGLSIPIPFTFNFFGTDYTSCYVSTNGLMVFGGINASPNNASIPTSGTPNNFIAAYWDDLWADFACSSAFWKYETIGTTPNRVFIVCWNDFRRNGEACGSYISFQIKLFETSNDIEVHLKSNSLIANNSGTIGIENSDGTAGNEAVYNVTISDGSAWKWALAGCTLPGSAGNISGNNSVCQGQSFVGYTVNAISNATSYIWTYTGSNTSITGTSNSISVNFSSSATSGDLTVQGTNACGDGVVSANYPITVNSLPGASGVISGSPTVCQSQTGVAYSVGAITGATSYTWAYSGIGATIVGTSNNVTINFSSTSTNGVLTVKGTNSCGSGTVSANYAITVNSLPSASGVISGTVSVCQGQTNVAYNVGTISGATSYTWEYSGIGATISGTTNPVTINFSSSATSGNLTVKGTNSCGSGTVSSDYPITVNPLPSVAGTITGSATVNPNDVGVSYSVPAISNATSYIWAYSGTGATITGTANSVLIDFSGSATSGNLTVYGTNSCGNGTVSVDFPISVLVCSPPDAAGSISGTASVCLSQSGVVYSVGAITGATSYTWAYSGTGVTITGSTNSVSITFSGSATSGNLTVFGTNACNNGTVSANYPITVSSLPGASGLISGTSAVCPNQMGVTYDVGIIVGATSYTWAYTGTGATLSGTTNSVTIDFSSSATSGNLTVRGTNACGNGTVSADYAILVNPLPSASGTITGTSTVCAGTTNLSYSVPAITNATSYTWAYSGTNATISGSTDNITINFASNATSGNLTIYGVNSCGNGAISANYPITITTVPSASGTITGSSTVCQSQSGVAYSVGAISGATSYTWAYSGTGATITGTTNSVTIDFSSSATSGNLTVKGTNSCGDGTVSANYPIIVNLLPSASGIISGTASVCQNQLGVAYNVGAITDATSYTWAYSGTGATITGTTNSVTIDFSSTATSGNLTVRGTNTCGNGTASANYPISVNPLPSASGVISGTSSVCVGTNNVNYSVVAITNASSYTWAYSGTGATITGTTNSITINFASNATSGNLTVFGVNSCGNGAVSANYPITITSVPSASGTITGSSAVCQGQSGVAYSVGAITGATSYTWAFSGTGATITGTTNSVTINFSSTATIGNLTVKGSNSCGDGIVSADFVINVSNLPSAAGNITGSATVCQGQNGVSYSVPAISGATSYSWSFSGTGATITGTTRNITINFSPTATSGDLTVTGINTCGSGTGATNYVITVNPLPIAAGTISGTSTVCAGTSNVTYSVPVITNATNYIWTYSGTGATITGTTNTVTINFSSTATSGNLTVKGNNNCGNGTVSANYAITVNPLPSNAGNITGSITVCTGVSNVPYSVSTISNATGYNWIYSGTGATISGATNSVLINFASNASSGILTVIGTNGCGVGATSANKSITVNTIPADAGGITGTSTVCQGQSGVSFSVPVITAATSYTWSYSGTGASITGSSNIVTITFSSSSTSGNLKVKGNNSCGSGAESVLYPIIVNPLPSAANSITGTSSICAGVSGVNYSTNAINNAVDYGWTYSGSGVTINGTTNNVTLDFASNATSGQLKVRGQNACGLGNISSAYTINITSGVPATLSSISGEDTLCAGDNYTLYTVNTVQEATSYNWTFSGTGGAFSNSTSNSVLNLTNDATSGIISVYCTNLCGAGGSSPDFYLTIKPLPESVNGISGTAVICAGQTGISYSVPPALNVDSYIWTYSGVGETINGNSENITLDFASNATSGQLKVKSQNTCGYGLISSPFNITVCPSIPVLNTNPNNLMRCPGNSATFSVNASGVGLNYQWYKDGNPILNATGSTYSFIVSSTTDEGGFYCEISNACGNVVSSIGYLDVNVPEILIHPISQTRCAGDTVTFIVSASGSGLSYQWLKNGNVITGKTQPILSLNSLTSANSGNYSCRVSNPCSTIFSDDAVLTVNQLGITSQPSNKIVCPGDNVTFSISVTGVSLSYQWKKNNVDILGENSSSLTINSVASTDIASYSCEVTNTCTTLLSNSASLTLNLPIITLQPSTLVKCLGNPAQFKIISSGTGLSYQWYHNSDLIVGETYNTYDIGAVSDLYTGEYYCIVTNICGADTTDTVSLMNNTPSITLQPVSQSACIGDDILFNVASNGSDLLYKWKKNGSEISGQTNDSLILSSISSTSGAFYTCQVSNSCSTILSDVATLTLNNIFINSQPASQNVCNGENVTFNVVAIGLSINYQWRKNGIDITGETLSSITLTNLDVSNIGDYSCYMTNICDTIISSVATLSLSNPDLSFITGVNSSCEGYIKASVSSGVSPYIYNWESGESTDSITGTEIGTYYLTLTDAFGCTANDSIEILNNPIVVSSIISSVDASCNNSCNGSAVISGTDGLQPYSYLWDVNASSQTNDTATNLCAGIYSVTVFDSNLCSSVSYITINEPSALDVSVIATNTDCAVNNGMINASVSGGTSPYSYNWSNGGLSASLINLSAGNYELTVTDANLCDTVVNTLVEYNSSGTLSIVANSTNCYGSCDGSAIALSSGGTPPYSFSWSNSATNDTIENICSGWYFVTSTDGGGCVLEDSVFVEQPDSIMLSFTVNDVSCFGENDGSIDLAINGGTEPYILMWSNDLITEDIDNLSAGFYTVSTSDVNGCQSVDSVEVIQPDGMLISLNVTNTSCTANTGILEAIISGGVSPYTVEWSDGFFGNPNTDLGQGVYTVTVSDFNNCYQIISDTVNYELAPQLSVSFNNVNCYDSCNGDAQVLISGGTSPFSINWSNGETSASLSNICAGNYVVTVTDVLGCSAEESILITEPNSINISFDVQDATCFNDANGSIFASVMGGISPYSILWSNDSITENISNLVSGTYYLTVTDQNNCIKTDFANVGEPAEILPVITGAYTVCGSSATLSTSNLFSSYQWTLNGEIITNAENNSISATSSGDYTVLVSNGTCYGTSNIHSLNIIDVVVPVIEGNSSVCTNDFIILTVPDIYESYLWKRNGVLLIDEIDDSLFVNSAGSYSVIVSIGFCTKTSASKTITLSNLPTITTQPLTLEKCLGQTAQFKVIASGTALSFQWYKNGIAIIGETTSNNTIAPLAFSDEGSYFCQIMNSCGEIISDTVDLIIKNPQIISQPQDVLLCSGDSTTFSISATGYNNIYKWRKNNSYISGQSNDQLTIDSVVTSDVANYLCVVTNSCGSATSNTVTLSLNNAIITTQPVNKNVCEGDTTYFKVISTGTGLTYQWYFDSLNIIGSDTNKYTIQYVTSALEGKYFCVVSNTCGADTSNQASLVIKKTIISNQPKSIYKCIGNNVQFKVVASGPSLTYQWKKDGYIISNAVSNTLSLNSITQNSVGIYKCVINNSCGSSITSDTAHLRINTPMLLSNPVGAERCIGDSVMFTVSATGNPVQFYWRKNGGVISGATNDTLIIRNIKATNDAKYHCYIYNSCSSLNSDTVSLNVHTLPISFTALSDTNNNCNGSISAIVTDGTEPYKYLWNDVLNQTTPFISGLCTDYYSLTVTDSIGCVNSDSVFVNNLTSILSLGKEMNINIFPNPAYEGLLNVYFQSDTRKELDITLVDVMGKFINSTKIENINSGNKLDISNLPTGIYYLTLSYENRSQTYKVVIYN